MYTFIDRGDYYNPEELADLFKVKKSTIYSWISRGELNAFKHGYSRAITPNQIEEFVMNRKSGKYNFVLEHIR